MNLVVVEVGECWGGWKNHSVSNSHTREIFGVFYIVFLCLVTYVDRSLLYYFKSVSRGREHMYTYG